MASRLWCGSRGMVGLVARTKWNCSLFKPSISLMGHQPHRSTSTMKRSIRSMFGKYLIYTNTISSGFLMVLGDLVQQEIEYQRNIMSHRYEWDRCGRMFLTGLLLGTPQHWFYLIMDKRMPGNTLAIVSKKILLDQLIASPFCIIVFFMSMGLLEGRSLHHCIEEIRQKFLTVIIVDWCVWPPTQFLNFYYLDGKYRVLYVNAATMLYNIFLSYIKHVDYEHSKK